MLGGGIWAVAPREWDGTETIPPFWFTQFFIFSAFRRGADVVQLAIRAIRLARGTTPAAVEDQPVAEVSPTRLRKEFHQVLLDADRVAEFGEAEPLGEAADMGIHDDAFIFRKGISEDDIGRFASRAGNGGEFCQGIGNFARMPLDEHLAHGADVFRLVPIESRGSDEALEFLLRNRGIVLRRAAALEKLKSNLQEVRARGGVLYVLADADTRIESGEGLHVIRMPEHYGALSPLLHVVPLQLLAYHTACARGTDVDKPRNLAKSVTVE